MQQDDEDNDNIFQKQIGNCIVQNFTPEFTDCLVQCHDSELNGLDYFQMKYTETKKIITSQQSNSIVLIGLSQSFKKVNYFMIQLIGRTQKDPKIPTQRLQLPLNLLRVQSTLNIQSSKYIISKIILQKNTIKKNLKVVDYIETETEFILVTEFLNQSNYLKDKLIEQFTPIKNELKMKSYISDIAEALAYLHKQGFIHCDVRLENMYCQKEKDDIIRNVKLADFGLIQIMPSEVTLPLKLRVKENHPYFPKELKVGEKIDEKFDIFCLGVSLYQMCVGYSPCVVVNTPSVKGQVPIRNSDWGGRSKELLNLVKAMMNPNPVMRPTALQILEDKWLQS